MKKALLILGLLILTGCATGHWEKVGTTQEEFNRDTYECQYRAETACQYWHPGQNVFVGIICVVNHHKDCMFGHGYQWVTGKPR